MHEIQRTAGGFVAWKICENTQQNGRARLCRWSEYVNGLTYDGKKRGGGESYLTWWIDGKMYDEQNSEETLNFKFNLFSLPWVILPDSW